MAVTLQSDRFNVNGKWVHCDGTNLGFLNTGGGWEMYVNNGGSVWTSNYGWLHDYFFYNTSNCIGGQGGAGAINCYGSGNISAGFTLELIDGGSNVYQRNIQTLTNCNCACDCL